MNFWDAASSLPAFPLLCFALALLIAFGFEFINGFHDTANAVTTVIYTRTLSPTPAVIYSGVMNFLGVLLGGTAVAFGIVNLLPVDLLVDSRSGAALVMVLSLLIAGVVWNLGTWYVGLPVSSSHTLIGSILGVGIANGIYSGAGLAGVNWGQVQKVGLALLFSPLLGFLLALVLLLVLKLLVRSPRLYAPPIGGDRPPGWVRGVLVGTCGAVSYAHGSNDGQKGMGLLLLVLIGFFPLHYALTVNTPEMAPEVYAAALQVREDYKAAGVEVPKKTAQNLTVIEAELRSVQSFDDLPRDKDTRWEVRQAIAAVGRDLKKAEGDEKLPEGLRKKLGTHRKEAFCPAVEYVPLWVVIGTALALGVGTTVGYKRIVVTVAEKIGKKHLTYGQGAAAETATAAIIELASQTGLSVSTTQVLNSAVAGTMVANGCGVQRCTVVKILLAWVLTLPACMMLSGTLFLVGRMVTG